MKAKTEVIRVQDQLFVRCFINCAQRKRFDTCSIEIHSGGNKVPIISTTEGRVENDTVHSTKTTLTIMFDHVPHAECIVGYYRNDEIVDQLAHNLIIENVRSIEASKPDMQKIESMNADFNTRQENFSFSLKKIKRTPWRLRMIIEEDIIVRVNTEGKQPVFVAFGEVSDGLLSTDLIFSVSPGMKKFVIPKEVVWKRYEQYSQDVRFACSQIVQADFHNISDVYYKMTISNILPLTEFPKKVDSRRLRDFRTPLGGAFDKRYWKMGELPIPRES